MKLFVVREDMVQQVYWQRNWRSAFGLITVSKGIHEWNIKILKRGRSLVFGICTQTKNKNDHFHNLTNITTSPQYFSYSCGVENDRGMFTKPSIDYNPNIKLKDNDEIKLTLDLNKGTLIITKLIKKMKEHQILINIDNVEHKFEKYEKCDDIHYRLAVSNYWADTKLQLISYVQIK